MASSSSGKLGSGYITAQMDPNDLKRVENLMRMLPKKVADNLAAKGMRLWGSKVRRVARKNAYKWAERTKAQMFTKIKKYKNAVWCAVGVRTNDTKRSKQRTGRFDVLVGWKSHFMEFGWHAWPKGLNAKGERAKIILRNQRIDRGEPLKKKITVYMNGKPHVRTILEKKITLSSGSTFHPGRGWRRGVRGRLGAFQHKYAKHYMQKAAEFGSKIALKIVGDSVYSGIKEAQKSA